MQPIPVPVQTVRVDDLVTNWPRVDFIKVDVEGAEVQVWRGLRATLARNPDCVVAMEVSNARNYHSRAFYQEIAAEGYCLGEVIPTGDVVPTTPEELVATSDSGWMMLWIQREDPYAEASRRCVEDMRRYFLQREADRRASDSSRPSGLRADLRVSTSSLRVRRNTMLYCEVTVTNAGDATWLASSARPGGVRIGAHLLAADGSLLDRDYFRSPLIADEDRSVPPGETLRSSIQVPAPPPGRHIIEFDLVAEGVSWFW